MLTRLLTLFRFCLSCLAAWLGIHLIPRRHKHTIHFSLLGVIAWDLVHAGAKLADLGFLVLALIMEAEGEDPPVKDDRAGVHQNGDEESNAIPGLSDAYNALVVPDASTLLDRLKAWIATQHITLTPDRGPDADPISNLVNGESWYTDPSQPATSRMIWIRPTLSPSLSLYVLIHELGHLLGRVNREMLTLSGKNPNQTGIPCWIHPLMLNLFGPGPALEHSAEMQAEHTTRMVFVEMGWDTTAPDIYLDGKAATVLAPCLVDDTRANAHTIASVLRGEVPSALLR